MGAPRVAGAAARQRRRRSARLSAARSAAAGSRRSGSCRRSRRRPSSAWFRARGRAQRATAAVLLWPDTFNNHFHPDVGERRRRGARGGRAPRRGARGHALLRTAALRLRLARSRRALPAAHHRRAPDEIRAGIPIVGLEPSCVAVFRDELASCSRTTRTPSGCERRRSPFTEFLDKHAPTAQPPHARAQGASCTATATTRRRVASTPTRAAARDGRRRRGARRRLLRAWPAPSASRPSTTTSRCRAASAACCPRCASRRRETLVVADGFSCKTQIEQGNGRRALHVAQVAQARARAWRGRPAPGRSPSASTTRGEPKPSRLPLMGARKPPSRRRGSAGVRFVSATLPRPEAP